MATEDGLAFSWELDLQGDTTGAQDGLTDAEQGFPAQPSDYPVDQYERTTAIAPVDQPDGRVRCLYPLEKFTDRLCPTSR